MSWNSHNVRNFYELSLNFKIMNVDKCAYWKHILTLVDTTGQKKYELLQRPHWHCPMERQLLSGILDQQCSSSFVTKALLIENPKGRGALS